MGTTSRKKCGTVRDFTAEMCQITVSSFPNPLKTQASYLWLKMSLKLIFVKQKRLAAKTSNALNKCRLNKITTKMNSSPGVLRRFLSEEAALEMMTNASFDTFYQLFKSSSKIPTAIIFYNVIPSSVVQLYPWLSEKFLLR